MEILIDTLSKIGKVIGIGFGIGKENKRKKYAYQRMETIRQLNSMFPSRRKRAETKLKELNRKLDKLDKKIKWETTESLGDYEIN